MVLTLISWAGHNVHLDCQKAHSSVTDGQTELSVLHLVGQGTAAKCFPQLLSELCKHPYMLWAQHRAPALPNGWVSRRRFRVLNIQEMASIGLDCLQSINDA